VPLKHNKLSLYCKPYCSADSTTAAHQTISVLHPTFIGRECHITELSITVLHTTYFSTQCHSSTAIYRCTAHHIIHRKYHVITATYHCTAHQNFQQTIPLYHSKISRYSTPKYSAHCATVAQPSIAVMHTKLFSRQCHLYTAIFRCTAHHINQQTVPR